MNDALKSFDLYPGIALSLTFRIGSLTAGAFDPWNLTGFTITSQAVALSSDEDAVSADSTRLATFTTAITLPQSGPDEGEFVLSLTAEQTAELDFGRAYFDAILEDTGGAKSVVPLGWLICVYPATEV